MNAVFGFSHAGTYCIIFPTMTALIWTCDTVAIAIKLARENLLVSKCTIELWLDCSVITICSDIFYNRPVTLLRIVLAYASVWKYHYFHTWKYHYFHEPNCHTIAYENETRVWKSVETNSMHTHKILWNASIYKYRTSGVPL